MKASTAIGIGVGLAGLLVGAMMEGTQVGAFFNFPALLIVLGGTFGATLASSGLSRMKQVPQLYRKAFSPDLQDLNARVEVLVTLAEKGRREGLLALEDDLPGLEDGFARKGLQLVVDGTEPELVREILDNEIDGMAARHQQAGMPFHKAGGFAPTMGILGTVMGLVHVLGNLAQPATLGPAISGAFIATLYGVGAANVVLLPVANRLQALSQEEIELRTLTLEGVLAIQSGDNPRVVADKLAAFIPPAERSAAKGDGQPIAGDLDRPQEPAAVAA
jgi:chemotaxis protein MotA